MKETIKDSKQIGVGWRLVEPERRTCRVTWVRSAEICAEVTLEPGHTEEELVAAIEAGMFCLGEVNDPETGERIANVVTADEAEIDVSGVVVVK